MDEWYKVTAKDIIENGGSRVLTAFASSPSKLFQCIYPEYTWKLSRQGESTRSFGTS